MTNVSEPTVFDLTWGFLASVWV